ncbi:MAG: ribosome biogenesis GTPase Der [Proteobacteria bacterium]|nr:ribosome biogenesis GTPase Der [Pseudomonadota bacterium]MBU1417360.1 ribosome biogenesis GTPase Der [Pseudomonadota bacterium]MBU1455313.1 ribosome biogenesis GTPase Der [Pseudomonadota bacterium]
MPTQTHSIVALVGRPNVGKSTLFNRITRSRKALVDPTPGVTRDRHYEKVVWNDNLFMLVDTGGIADSSGDVMGDHIRDQAMAAIEEADIILFLLDGREGVTPADKEVTNLLRRTEKTIFYVVNKIDGPEQEDEQLYQFYELGVDKFWPLSAEHKYGFADLMNGLEEKLQANDEELDLPEGTIKIAFFGRPNVGKSSMINQILGQERMVVSEVSGTTRDSVDTLLNYGKYNYLLIDTAGIRRKGKTTEKLEKFSILKALAALEKCDIAVVLIDAGEGITEQDTKVIGYTQEQGRGLILLVNKWDLVQDDKIRQEQIMAEIATAAPFVGFAPLLTASALTGYGIKRLFPTIGSVFKQFTAKFPTAALNRLLQDAVEAHSPPIYKNKRLKFYYTSQVGSRPPKFVVMSNSSKGVHFSYERYLVNRFRDGLGLDKVPLQLFIRDKNRDNKNKK